jgi:hypothetical protein
MPTTFEPTLPRLRVFHRRRWPARFFVILYALDGPLVVGVSQPADRAQVAALFGIALAVCLVWLYASERRAIHVEDEGLRVVPYFGPAKRYAWPSIRGFTVANWSRDEATWGHRLDTVVSVLYALFYRGGPTTYPRPKGGPTVMVEVSDRAAGFVPLSLTRRWPHKRDRVERTRDQFEAELWRHSGRRSPGNVAS